MRLIDADELKKKIKHWNYNVTTSTPTFKFVTDEDIDYMPTVCDIEQSAILMRKLYEEYEHNLEQIRAEIESEIRDIKANATEFGNAPIRFFNKGVRTALNIIDKHTQ